MLKKGIFFSFFFLLLCFPTAISAQRGCCSHHGGVAGCNSNGRQVCNDGTLSPTCGCTPKKVYGCTDPKAKNYNAKANKNNGSCKYYKYGCTDSKAKNYNKKAEKDDGSCKYYKYGCMDKNALNYDPKAEKSDKSCIPIVYGCVDKRADNYDIKANKDDGSCTYLKLEEKEKANQETVQAKEDSEDNTLSGILGLGIIGCFSYALFKKKQKKEA